MKNILLVDTLDNQSIYFKKLVLILKSGGYNLTISEDLIKVAELIQSNNLPEMVILNHLFFEDFVKFELKNIKNLILTDDENMNKKLSTTNALNFEFLVRPQNVEIIKLVVDEMLSEKNTEEEMFQSFYALTIDELSIYKNHDIDIYIKINNQFILYGKTGQEFSQLKYKLLIEKGIKILYLNSIDFAKYNDLSFTQFPKNTNRCIQRAYCQKALSFFQNRLNTNSTLNFIDSSKKNISLERFEKCIQLAMENDYVLKSINQMIDNIPFVIEKNSLTATISSCVADLWKWNSPKIQSRILIGSILCDIGLKDYSHIIDKKKFELDKIESKIYEEHPLRSYQLLSQIEDLPPEILQIAMQHHENSIGSGYPQKLIRSHIHSFAKLIHGVSEFVDSVFSANGQKTPSESLSQIYLLQRKIVSEQVLKSLYKVFEVDIPNDLESVTLPDKSGMLI